MTDDETWLWGGAEPPARRYRTVLLDLDGVVYLVGEPIPGAPETISGLRADDVAVRFVTNNASRRPAEVADLLTGRGISAVTHEVYTSSQAAARILRDHCGPDAQVLVIGSDALAAEVTRAGLRPVRDDTRPVAAVVQGYGPQVGWRELSDATVEVRSGVFWVATNTDATMPSPRGPLPGNGTMVAVVATAAGRQPDVVAGKPSAELLERAVDGLPDPRPIMVGDRWDTDIAAAVAAGMPGMLVLSGATDPAEVLRIPPYARPRYLAWTVAGLTEPHTAIARPDTRTTVCGQWTVVDDGAVLGLSGSGQPLDALRALAEAAWRREDTEAASSSVDVRGTDSSSQAAVRTLGLAG